MKTTITNKNSMAGNQNSGRRKGDKDKKENKSIFTSETSKRMKEEETPEQKSKRMQKTHMSRTMKRTASRVVTETQDYMRNSLVVPDENGHVFMHDFIDSFLKEAKKNPNSRAAGFLAQSMFTPDLLSKLDDEVNKQMAKDSEFVLYRIRKTLYPKQQIVYDDETSRTIECICTRRAGKTELVARLLVRECCKAPYITPNGKPLDRCAIYLNRTFDNAVGQMGKPVTDLLDSLDIKYSGSPGSGTITLDNGATITFGGYNNKGEIDKYRGYHYSLVCIDEISHLRNPENLLKETLEPAMTDYGKDAHLIMTGTPPRSKKNYAYRQWHNPNITHYHWSFMDNPFIPEKETVIEKICQEHGVTVDAPFIQREYFGNLEAFDIDAMPFKGHKTIEKLPDNIKTIERSYIGIDWGFDDEAAVVSFIVKDKKLYPIDEWHASKQAISTICNEARRQFDYIKANFNQEYTTDIICDNNEKSAVYELSVTYNLPNVYCAYKYNKDIALEQLAEWMRTDKIYVKKDGYLDEESENTLWKRDEETDEIIHEIDDENYHPNGLMALLYISRQYAFDVLGFDDCSGTNIKDGE